MNTRTMVLVRVLMLVTNSLLLMGPGKVLSAEFAMSIEPDSLSWTEGFAGEEGLHVKIFCNVTGLGDDVLLQSVIFDRRTKADSGFVHVATTSPRHGTWIQPKYRTAMSRSYVQTAHSFIFEVGILAARCEDAGTYRCQANIDSLLNETLPRFIADKNLHEVNPDLVTMTSDPEGVREWTEGQTLRLTCYAAVGSLSNVSDPQLVWRFRKNGEETWSELNNNAMARIETAVTEVECIKRWNSTLTIRLTRFHTGREYGCFLRRDSVDNLESAVAHSVGTITEVTFSLEPDALSGAERFAEENDTQVFLFCNITGLGEHVKLNTFYLQRRTKDDPGFQNMYIVVIDGGRAIQGSNMPMLGGGFENQTTRLILKFYFTARTCRDAGNYRCKAEVLRMIDYTASNITADENLREVNPDLVTLTSDPEGVREWTVGQLLKLTCHAAVGSLSTVSDPRLVWQFRKNGEEQWSERGIRESDIETAVTEVKCIKRWSSALTITLTSSHHWSEYRCFLRRGSMDFLQSAVVHSVGTVIERLSWVNVGVGIALGLLAALGITVLLFCYVNKRRTTGEHRSQMADDDGGKTYPKPHEAQSAKDSLRGPGRELNTAVTNPDTGASQSIPWTIMLPQQLTVPQQWSLPRLPSLPLPILLRQWSHLMPRILQRCGRQV